MTRSKAQRTSDFEDLVLPHLDRLFAVALRLTRTRSDAEDLVQETVMRALEAFDGVDRSGNIAGWLYRILTNLFINSYRHERVVRRTVALALTGSLDDQTYSRASMTRWSDPFVRHTHSHLSTAMETALTQMDERFRTVLILADLMDFTYREIAIRLRIPEGTVMSRLFRARRFLRSRLGSFANDGPLALESSHLSRGRTP